MAFAQMSATGKDAVRSVDKTFHKENRVNATRTHHPDDAHMRRILKTGHTGSISSGIATPVAKETQDLRFECVNFQFAHSVHLSAFSKGSYLSQDLFVGKPAHADGP